MWADFPPRYQVNLVSGTPPYCPGTYRYSAKAMYDDDYNGKNLVLHSRIYAGSQPSFGIQNAEAVRMGAFPDKANEWQNIEIFLVTPVKFSTVVFFIGYSPGGYSGNVYVTDVSFSRWDDSSGTAHSDLTNCV